MRAYDETKQIRIGRLIYLKKIFIVISNLFLIHRKNNFKHLKEQFNFLSIIILVKQMIFLWHIFFF